MRTARQLEIDQCDGATHPNDTARLGLHLRYHLVGGTSVAAHEAALRRIEQAGGKLISTVQLFCELQRDWKRSDTVPAFLDLFIQTGGTPGIQFSYDKAE